jgi:hypothetical protein
MGISVEFNPDLALRAHGTRNRHSWECLPEELIPGESYQFRKSGQRVYWFEGEIPLLETKGNEQLSRPLAGIKIIEATHRRDHITGELMTVGWYEVVEVFDLDDPTIHFEGFAWQRPLSKHGRA